jgi:hypothetical protein
MSCAFENTERLSIASVGLIGVEYMIRSSLWETLPEEEKKYWHSHRYEVCRLYQRQIVVEIAHL